MRLAIDIGGTKIAMANVVDGRCVDRRQLPMPRTEAVFLDSLRALASGRPAASRVAVAVTGCFDGRQVRAVNRQTISFWDDYPLIERLQALLGARVSALNDAQAAAWGEAGVRGVDAGDLLFITLSTGVGAGLVLDGRLRIGRHGLAGHIGHAAVDVFAQDAPVACGCGRFNCLETVASGTALARQASRLSGRVVSSAELFEQARQGQARAEDVLDRAAAAVASAVANLHVAIDLDRVVLGGSVGLAPGMRERIERAFGQLPVLHRVVVEHARLGADAGLLGASGWCDHLDARAAAHG